MIDSLYQKLAEQANSLETWVVVLALGIVGYLLYKHLWLGVLTITVTFTGWVFYTLLNDYNLQKEKEAVGFLVIFMLVALVVNGTLLYKTVNDS